MAKPITIDILGDNKRFKASLKDSDSATKKFAKGVGKIGGAIAGAFAVSKVVGFASEIGSLSTNLELMGTKISTVFGDAEGEIRAWADTVNEQFGLTETATANLAAQTADLLKPIGFTADAAAAMSKEIVGLSPALAEWSAGQFDAAQVGDILNKAILGEREGLKALGISISQAEVDERALIVARKEGRDEINAMDKALATQQLVLEKSTDAQAAYTGGTETLAGKQAFLSAKIAEVKEALATKLIPVMSTAMGFIIDRGIPAVQGLADRFRQDVLPVLKELAQKWFPRVRSAISKVVDIVVEASKFVNENREVLIGVAAALAAVLIPALVAWAASAAAAAVATLAAAAPLIALGVAVGALAFLIRKLYRENETFRAVIDTVWRVLREKFWPAFKDGIQVVKEVIEQIAGFTKDVAKKVSELVSTFRRKKSDIRNAITAPFKAAFDWVQEKWQALKDLFSNFNPFGGLSGLIPGRAMGGPVARTGMFRINEQGSNRGERVILPRGSNVVPAHANRGGGNVTVNVSTNSDPHQIGREVAWSLQMGVA